MQYNPLGHTDIAVSALCLGSMTWGTQNSEAEGHRQMDMAVAAGVNFIDTAEMYPTTPMARETVGRTEEIIGTWLAGRSDRDRLVIATKITGNGSKNVRDGGPITPASMRLAVEGSLSRLKTDVIDLYQLHWPNRGSYHFRQSWHYDPTSQDREETRAHIVAVLETAAALIQEGKIRTLGLSNETTWGTARFLWEAEARGLPRVVSVQNEYSLLQRLYDTDFAELAHQEKVGLLAFSPLAAGLLTGKYRGDATPPGSRRSINAVLGGRISEHSVPVADAYVALAEEHGLDPAQMAIAWCLTRPFMTSAIIGATTEAQLATNLAAADLTLPEPVRTGIATIHRKNPIPM